MAQRRPGQVALSRDHQGSTMAGIAAYILPVTAAGAEENHI
jgi:hypothetical protein